jgi:hypothetical protein
VNDGYFTSHPGAFSAAIGTGQGEFGGKNSIGNISIKCQFFDSRTGQAGCIGCGNAADGSTTIGSIVIYDGNYFLNSVDGTGIGTGRSQGIGVNILESITIYGGNFSITIESNVGSGIGTGPIEDQGIQKLDWIKICGGNFSIITSDGIGIGGGRNWQVEPQSITNYDDNLSINAKNGAGIGSAGNSQVEPRSRIIYDGNFSISTMYGAGIGSGIYSDVEPQSIIIYDGNFSISTYDGAGIGGLELEQVILGVVH